MNLAQASAATALEAVNALYGSATLTLYDGAIPATPETATDGQAALVAFIFANPAFAAPQFSTLQEVAAASFVSPSVTPTASGTACFARAVASANDAVLADYTVGASWQPAAAVMAGQYVVNGGNSYLCLSAGTTGTSGGPTGVSTSIADGTAVWSFNNVGSTDIVMATTSVLKPVPVTVTNLTHAFPAV